MVLDAQPKVKDSVFPQHLSHSLIRCFDTHWIVLAKMVNCLSPKMSLLFEIYLEIERSHWYLTAIHLDSFKNYCLKMAHLQ